MEKKQSTTSNSNSLVKYRELMSLFEKRGFIKDFKDALDSPFEVMLMAPMSSGKTTLINAMLGCELLPTANQACTATVYRIEDNDAMKTFRCRAAFGDSITPWKVASHQFLKEWNSSGDCNLVEIEGNLPFIRNTGAKLVLYDTPGPNFSCDKRHSETLSRALSNLHFGVIVFLLNANNLGTDDERLMLNQILEVKKSNKKFNKRTVFIISKADQFDEEDGESLKRVVREVRAYLRKTGFKNPKIIPIMAEAALLARKLATNTKLSKREQLDLIKYLDQTSLSPKYTIGATMIDKHIVEMIDNGIQGRGQHISQNNQDAREFLIRGELSVTKRELNKFLYSTGLHTLEQYFECLITHEALPKTMIKVAKVLKKYGALSLLNWIESDLKEKK